MPKIPFRKRQSHHIKINTNLRRGVIGREPSPTVGVVLSVFPWVPQKELVKKEDFVPSNEVPAERKPVRRRSSHVPSKGKGNVGPTEFSDSSTFTLFKISTSFNFEGEVQRFRECIDE